MRKTLLLIFTALSLLTCNAQEQGSADIIPMPNKLEVTAGRVLRLGSEVKISIPKDLNKRKAIVGYLEGRLNDNNIHTRSTTAKKAQLLLVVDNTLQDEAYELTVTPKRAVIKSNAQGAGFFYGVQSFMQLVPADADAEAAVQCVEIKDAPRFQYRGAMIDVARNFQSKQTVLRFIDLMAAFKMNRLHIHLTDDQGWRIEIKRYPRLTEFAAWREGKTWKEWSKLGCKYMHEGEAGAYGGYYTQDELRDLVKYAAERGITIVPEIEMPGHSAEVLTAYPELSCTHEPYKQMDFCPGSVATYDFLENVLKEVMDIFPSKYIHVGGDEADKASWPSCPLCQQKMKELGTDKDGLQAHLIAHFGKFLTGAFHSGMSTEQVHHV